MQAFWPVGTMVVIRCDLKDGGGRTIRPVGAAGRIVKIPPDPDHGYSVLFPDGGEEKILRNQMHRLKDLQKEASASLAADDEYDLWARIHYKCVVGSRAFGLSDEHSDTDRRGFYVAPTKMVVSLCPPPEQLQNDATQEEYWELAKFLTLALRANPNVLETLSTPLVEVQSDVAKAVLEMRSGFLSKLVYQTYSRYVMSQHKKLEQDIRNHGHVRWKHAMHLLRLLMAGKTVLTDGFVPVDVSAHRDQLLAVKRGELPWADVDKWWRSLHAEMELAFSRSNLPDHPDYDKANALLVDVRQRFWA